jgi:hypothetical protein
VLPVLGEHAERPALVIGEDKVVRVQADGGSVLAGPVPGGFGVGVVGVRALSNAARVRNPYTLSSHNTPAAAHIDDKFLPVLL